MAENLIPIAEFPIAAALPDFVPAERIGVDAVLVGRIAQWGCFADNVTLTAYSGETTSYDAGVTGMDSAGAATASASAVAKKAPLAQFSSGAQHKGPAAPSHAHHVSPLTIASNIPEIQQRLGEQRANLREPKPWAQQLHASIGEGLRAAAYNHLLTGQDTREEAIRELRQMLWATAGTVAIQAAISVLTKQPIDTGDAVGAMLSGVVAPGGLKAAKRANGIGDMPANLRELCLSALPGYHLDRYAAVWGLTKARKLVRPIK